MPSSLKKYLAQHRTLVEAALKKILPKKSEKPRPIHEAMRYSVMAGGKRLRPLLVMAAAEAVGGSVRRVMSTACALELIHTYSLIHDDLPAMDDDDLRRGRPTNHKVYGDDIAILTGDSLLTLAFQLIAQNAGTGGIRPSAVVDVIRTVAEAAGTSGMIGGQVADIKSDKGRWKRVSSPKSLLDYIHLSKTAALIRGSLLAGGILSGATAAQRRALDLYGRSIGLAFQIQDDILDQIGDKKKLGKKGSDQKNQKLTYPAIYGLSRSQTMAAHHIQTAHKALRPLGNKAHYLHQLADYILSRDH